MGRWPEYCRGLSKQPSVLYKPEVSEWKKWCILKDLGPVSRNSEVILSEAVTEMAFAR